MATLTIDDVFDSIPYISTRREAAKNLLIHNPREAYNPYWHWVDHVTAAIVQLLHDDEVWPTPEVAVISIHVAASDPYTSMPNLRLDAAAVAEHIGSNVDDRARAEDALASAGIEAWAERLGDAVLGAVDAVLDARAARREALGDLT